MGPGPGAATAYVAGAPAVPVPYRVVRRCPETADAATFKLAPAGETLSPFVPGQFAMLCAFGVGEIPVSVAGLPLGESALVHTVRTVGAVSDALYSMRPGATVGVRGPFGTGWDLGMAAGKDVLVIAGGIGLAPLRPVILDVLGERERFGRLSVLIGARTPADLLYKLQTQAWGATADVAVTVDRPAPGWRGSVGVVTRLLDRAVFRPADTVAYVCGPEPMIRATARELVMRGVPAHRIRVSLERNMRCGAAECGHCQLGPVLLCRDGPVIGWHCAEPLLSVPEL
ncbi:FAD/NAD(P)-binding protein [Streptomyces purpurogeneiscleroticus]|uniref:FAD/NAD(P)-binding protein n=1 Tax=Streptomyces purpurogeneiscleroticus TaxID=68259 RepID=UPI001CBF8A51|nr:FAD/NAD(P)-binding protein [Streptomyces purpurogeneiscleroticus]MBZ4018760.1 oxidoreductase [Streptomyces purpurogeneiscleroticus]